MMGRMARFLSEEWFALARAALSEAVGPARATTPRPTPAPTRSPSATG